MTKKEIENKNSDKKNPVAIILRNPEVAKQLELLRGAAEIGVKQTGKGLVVFYQRSTRIGEIIKDLLFVFFGISILMSGLFLRPADYLTVWNIAAQLEGGIIGRLIVIVIGLGLFMHAVSKLWNTLRLTEVMKDKDEKFVQKKLVSK